MPNSYIELKGITSKHILYLINDNRLYKILSNIKIARIKTLNSLYLPFWLQNCEYRLGVRIVSTDCCLSVSGRYS